MASSRYAFDPANPGKSYGQILAEGGSVNSSPNNVVTTGSPRFSTNTAPSPTNVGNPFGYGMSIPDNGAGTMPSGDDRKAYEDAMAKTYANVVTSPGLFGTDIGKQTGYTGQGSQSRAGIRAPSNSNTGGGAVSGGGSRAQSTGPAPIPEVLISQNLTQRPQTGNIYAPDLSAYNDSSLFNYTGPGGVDEYTYGQGLRTDGADYSIFGSPTDIANPYYEGQFAPKPTGPADGAIGMNPVQLPSNLPQIEVSADVSMPGFVGGGNQVIGGSLPTDLTYQQTIDSMGIFGPDNPPPSTTFPSPGDTQTKSDKEYQSMLNQSLTGGMDDTADIERGMLTSQRGTTMDDTADIERGMITSQRGTTMDDTDAIERGMLESQRGTTMDDTTAIQMGMMQGTPNPQSGLPVTQFGDVPQKTLTPLQQAARDASSNIDTRDFRFNPTGEQDKSLLQKWVESGPAYQPTSDSTIAEMEAMGNQVKSFADKTSQVRNLFDESVINTVGSPNQFEIQRAEADANQAALDKQRYNTQVNNPTADFSGYMKNYGSGFKEPAPVESLFKIEPSVQREIASRVASGGEAEGNELMLEAIGLGNVFTGSKVSSPEKKKAEAEIVSIFAGGPSRKSVKSEPAVVKSAPRVKVDYNKNKPVAVKKTKPTPRGPQPVKVTRTTGSRGSRGSSSKPKSSSPSRSYSVGQSAYRRGNR